MDGRDKPGHDEEENFLKEYQMKLTFSPASPFARKVRIAERHGLKVPLSARIVALIKRAEAEGKGSPGLTPDQIRKISS